MNDDLDQRHLDRAEARLRAALLDRTDAVQPRNEDASLDAIRRRAAGTGRRRTITRVLVVAAAVALVAGLPILLRDPGADEVTAGPGPTTTTPDEPSTVAAPPAGAAADDIIWPPPGRPPHDDPVEAARSFVEEYVGLAEPELAAFRPASAAAPGRVWSGQVDVLLRGEDGVVRPDRVLSTITLRGSDGVWTVIGATTADIVVDNPAPLATVGSPVVIDGRGRGYEGTIIASVRQMGPGPTSALGTGIATAGCCDELVPFHLEVALTTSPGAATGSVLLATDSGIAHGGSFAVVPVRFGPTPTAGPQASDETAVQVSWARSSGDLVSADRTVRRSGGVLRGALQQLLLGPTADERNAGLSSALSAEAAPVTFTVVLRDGRAVIDFGPDLAKVSANTSSSEGSRQFLRQLHATVFQFPTVAEAEYRLGGSCEAFWTWLQRSCTIVDTSDSGA